MTERDMERRKMIALEKIADALIDIGRMIFQMITKGS